MSEPPEIKSLDFSRFHPLDHWPWQCAQRNAWEPIYGGMRIHLKYAWEMKWRDQIRAATLCRLGIRHSYTQIWRREEAGGPMTGSRKACRFCLRHQPD